MAQRLLRLQSRSYASLFACSASSFADLNLATSDGRAALDGQIRAAAHNVCERDGESSVEALVSARSCFTAAVAKARHQADAVGVGDRDVALGSAVVTVSGQ